jgi:hypothetical protein
MNDLASMSSWIAKDVRLMGETRLLETVRVQISTLPNVKQLSANIGIRKDLGSK